MSALFHFSILDLTSCASVRKYEPRPYEIAETKHLVLFGEEQDPPDDDLKRTRALSHFAFFDAAQDNALVSLDVLDGGENVGHRIFGAGFVVARYDTDEDEGQEDDFEEAPEYIHLSRIHRYFTKYWEANRYVVSRGGGIALYADITKPILCGNGSRHL